MQANQLEQRNRSMGMLLRLENRVRTADSVEAIRFIAVNETVGLVGYEQAVVGSAKQGVLRLSGLSDPDLNAPYVSWLNKLLKHLKTSKEPLYLDASDLPKTLVAEWSEWLPAHLAALPVGGEWLLLARTQPFSGAEKTLIAQWCQIVGFHLELRRRRTVQIPDIPRLFGSPLLWLLVVLLATLFVPVKMSVLAPAEVVAKSPAIVRAPLDAVVSEVFISPYQSVEAGDLLFRFDARRLSNQLALAEQRINTAQAAYRQAAQQALVDVEAKNRLAILQADIEGARLEVSYLKELLSRTDIRAPIRGQVLMQSEQDWLGRPVSQGERMVRVANPERVELRGWLSPSDQVPMEPGAELILFDNSRPDVALRGRLSSVGLQVEEQPDGTYAFPVKGELIDTTDLPPIGSRGTIRIEGHEVSLAYLLIRRPLALVRQWLGV